MNRKWLVVAALLAAGCGSTFEAGPPGDDDASGAGDGESRDANVARDAHAHEDAHGSKDGQGAGDDGTTQGDDGNADGSGFDAADDANAPDSETPDSSVHDSGDEGGMDASKEGGGGKDSGPDAAHDGGGADGGNGDGGSWSSKCPANVPLPGSTCSYSGVQCEYPSATYGDKLQFDPSCNVVVECMSGIWTNETLGVACDPDGPNATSCPAAFTDITSGSTCTPSGLRCEYPKGVCTCDATLYGSPGLTEDSGAISNIVPKIDAGIAPLATWTCEPESNCPMPRPRLGASCVSTAQTTCTYQPCALGESCTVNLWQATPMACAGGTAP